MRASRHHAARLHAPAAHRAAGGVPRQAADVPHNVAARPSGKPAAIRHARVLGGPPRAGASFGTVVAQVPPGSVPLLPLEQGDQGISAAERPHALRAMQALPSKAGDNWVVTYDQESGLYEIVSKTGTLRWERWKTPAGEVVFRVHSLDGENPITSEDPTAFRTFAEEVAAAGGAGKPIPESITSYPDIFQRLSQLFDSKRAPDFVYVPTGGADLNHPGAGSHGVPDITQSRAPLIIAAPGVAQNAFTDTIVKSVDVAPTVAQLVGVQPIRGTNAAGAKKIQFLKWQDGDSVASSISDGRLGASPYGTAERALMFVLDGGSQAVLLDEVAQGRLPNIARIMKMGTTFRNGSIVDYPTVTWANHNTLMTGASPGHQGLLNNSWYNRDTGKEQLITDGGFQNSLMTNKMMNTQAETLYEAVGRTYGPDAITMSINDPSGRGATFSTLELAGLGGVVRRLFSVVKHFIDDGKSIVDHRFEKDKDYWSSSKMDRAGVAIGQAYFSSANTPRLAVFELALTDNQGHMKGPHAPDARAALQEADRNIGAMLKILDERGLTDSTALVVTADHGMEHQYTDPAKLGGWFDALR
ncbi:MAG: alkaline phosphatase family protein, partial [Thermoleophilia bacterium]|nr:alkaline phosphatase family protein [Thermoleophilia bacterium]